VKLSKTAGSLSGARFNERERAARSGAADGLGRVDTPILGCDYFN
jgi:hypothetical protein